jgi:putative redox protein
MATQYVRKPLTRSPGDARLGAGRDVVRTVCGREFTVGELRLEHLAHPAARVSLSTRPLPQDNQLLWASLTPDEARRLASHLVSHADAADPAGSAGSAPAQSVEVDYLGTGRYTVRLGGRHPFPAPPRGTIGDDATADPATVSTALELARRAERFLARHQMRPGGLSVRAQRPHPGESRALRVTIATPPGLTGERKNALRTLLCTSLRRDPAHRRLEVEINVT